MAAAPISPAVPRVLLLGAVLLLAIAWPLAPAEAADRTVEVGGSGDGAFTPATVRIHPGDTVTWKWTANEPHSVTLEDGRRVSCEPVPLLVNCDGATRRLQFDQEGEFPYTDDFTASTGTVVVEEPEPEPTPTSSSPSPSPEPTSTSPAPDPTPTTDAPDPDPDPTTDDPEPEPTPQPDPVDADPGPADDPEPDPTTRGPAGTDSPTSEGSARVPEPTFEGFPDAPEPSAEVSGEVALDDTGDAGGGASRVVWGTIGGLAVLGTAGAFGRVVLFGDAWGGGA